MKMKLTPNLRSAFTSRAVEEYFYTLLPKRDAVLAEMERYAEKHNVPIIGPAVARLLALLVMMSGAKRIFEMGSAVGYSAIWMARAAGPGAKIFCTDGNAQNAQRALRSARRAGVARRIEFLVGDALELIDRVPGTFDLIFIDVAKEQYPAALRKALPRLRRGGLLVADNTLWYGRVAHPPGKLVASTRGIQRFNRMVFSSRKLFPVLLPLRDGVTVAIRR
jgi:predicted O-methyltransferase YrrM